MKQEYSKEFIEKARIAKERGLNIYALLNRFYAISRLREPLPEAVLLNVLSEFENRVVRDPWPYFVKVLKSESEKYFSVRNEEEGKKFKREPAAACLKDIMAGMFK